MKVANKRIEKNSAKLQDNFWHKFLVMMVTSLYLISRYLRVVILQSGFGFTSHCKHQPTCGENFFIQVRSKGFYRGSLVALKQVVNCY